MALNYVTLTCDLYDGSGNPVVAGAGTFAPTTTLTDTADHELIGLTPVTVAFTPAGSPPVVKLLATDNGNVVPSGWGWTFTPPAGTGMAAFNFFLPFASGASQYLSAQAPVTSAATMTAYLPLPSGTAAAGQVPVASGSGAASAWGTPGTPLTTLGDTIYGGTAGAETRLAGNTSAAKNFLTQTGTGSASAAPAWATVTSGDLPAATTSVQGAVVLDGTAGDIKNTSSAAAAGASGKAADASHVHAQNFLGLFGDGFDGAVTMDGTTSFSGFSSLASSTYTLTRDVFATSLTVNNGVTLQPNGWRIFVTGTFTNNGTVSVNGGNASGTNGATGGTGYGSATLGSTNNGTNGGTGAGTQTSSTNGSSGGAGGAGGSGTSGSGGASRNPVLTAARPYFASPFWVLTGGPVIAGTDVIVRGGVGGSSGSGDGTNNGGGGGAGGGLMLICAWSIINNGTVSANGGTGGTPTTTTGGCGGGGGGGGGAIIGYSLSPWTAGTLTVTGGTGGGHAGTGVSGNSGNSGFTFNLVLT